MPDDKSKKKLDRRRISLLERYEVTYWCKRYGVSEGVLRRAVREVGHAVKDVTRYLKGEPPGKKARMP